MSATPHSAAAPLAPLVETRAKIGVFSIALGAYLPQFPELVPQFRAAVRRVQGNAAGDNRPYRRRHGDHQGAGPGGGRYVPRRRRRPRHPPDAHLCHVLQRSARGARPQRARGGGERAEEGTARLRRDRYPHLAGRPLRVRRPGRGRGGPQPGGQAPCRHHRRGRGRRPGGRARDRRMVSRCAGCAAVCAAPTSPRSDVPTRA